MQGDVVRQLKEQQRPELEVKAAVEELKKRKKALEQKVTLGGDEGRDYELEPVGEGAGSS